MVEEKFYELEDGVNMFLIEHSIYNNTRYLLLNKENTDDVQIGYEKDGSLVFIDDNYPDYNNIALSLLGKLEKSVNKFL